MVWVKPKLVAQIRFVEFTNDGHLRHAAFLGLRADKRSQDIHRGAWDLSAHSTADLHARLRAFSPPTP